LTAGVSPDPRVAWAGEILAADPSTGELLDLRVLLAQQIPRANPHWTRTRAELSQLLQDILSSEERLDPLGWWERILAWLRDLLRKQGDSDLRWLEGLLDSFTMSAEMAKRILYGITALALASLAVLFVYELRAAGHLRRKDRGAAGACPATSDSPSVRRVQISLSGIRILAPQRQPAAVLRLCIQELIARGLLPNDSSRTNRELHRALSADEAETNFGELVQLAERTTYGGYPVTERVLARCYADAAHILGAR
jgi:hypothetical protein